MNNRCITHNQHHCIHAHNCNNPLHKQKLAQSHSRENLDKKTLPRKQPQTQLCKSGSLKPPASSSLSKGKVGSENIRENVQMARNISPDCKNLEYQRMFLNLNQKYNDVLRELEELRRQKQRIEGELKSERLKNGQMQMELNKRKSLEANYNQLQAQYEKLKDLKKQLSTSQNKGLNLQGQIAKLKHTIQNLTLEKQRMKEQSSRNARKAGQIGEDLERENREKQNLKRKLQQSQSTIEDIQTQYKNLASKSKLNLNEVVDDYQKKLRSLDQKFSFSCDQLSESKKVEAKLRNKIKQLEEQLHSQKLKVNSKPKNSQPSKVEKELITLQQKTAKDNQKLRETVIEYQHDKRRLQQELSRTTTRLTDQIRQLEKLLRIKETEIEQLEGIKLSSEKEANLLRQNKALREKQRQQREQELRKAGVQIEDKPDRTRKPGVGGAGKQQTLDSAGIRGTYSQAIAIRHLQNRNAELQRQIQQLSVRVTIPGETVSINDYNEFEKVIKQSNKRIKDLIVEKGRQMEVSSKLKIEIMELKNQLASRSSSLSTNPQQRLQEQKVREISHLKNSLSELEFELKQVKNQNFQINNRYSDYYILKDDNEVLRMKLRELVDVIETLKKSIIHNSYQKEALIVDNQQLMDQLNLISSIPRF